MTPECRSTSYAIDAANYARQKVKGGEKGSVRFYDEEMQKQRELENEIVNDMKEAMEQKQFKVYFQPKYSIKIMRSQVRKHWCAGRETTEPF